MKRKRANKGANKTAEDKGANREVLTTEYRPIIKALADPIKREKLRAVCESLSGRATGKKNLLDKVYYGIGRDPTRMDEVDELLTAF